MNFIKNIYEKLKARSEVTLDAIQYYTGKPLDSKGLRSVHFDDYTIQVKPESIKKQPLETYRDAYGVMTYGSVTLKKNRKYDVSSTGSLNIGKDGDISYDREPFSAKMSGEEISKLFENSNARKHRDNVLNRCNTYKSIDAGFIFNSFSRQLQSKLELEQSKQLNKKSIPSFSADMLNKMRSRINKAETLTESISPDSSETKFKDESFSV